MTNSPADPTGQRFRLHTDHATAEITEVGAALRELSVDGVELVPRYPDDIATPAASGAVLVPWPNRVAGGRWTQRGETRQLAITEPKFGNASHGLLRFTPYHLVDEAADAVTLAATVFPQTGYPFHLDTTVVYRLDDAGLTVTHGITNVGAVEAPFAIGTHPYLQLGDGATADLELHVDAEDRFEVNDRMIPTAQTPVDVSTDLRTPRRVGDLSLDTAYSGFTRDDGDRISATLRAPDGRSLELWAGAGFDYLQVFTTDLYPGHPLAVAIEPMTAPADAFNSGQSLHWLAPGESWSGSWGIRVDFG